MVTQTAAGQRPAALHAHKVSAWKEAAAAQLAAAPSYPTQHQEVEPSSVRAPVAQPSNPVQPNPSLPSSEVSTLPVLLPVPDVLAPEQQAVLEENESSPQPEPLNTDDPPSSQLLDFQIGTEDPLSQTEQLKSSDIDDILKRVIEEEREKAERARTAAKADSQSEDVLRVI